MTTKFTRVASAQLVAEHGQAAMAGSSRGAARGGWWRVAGSSGCTAHGDGRAGEHERHGHGMDTTTENLMEAGKMALSRQPGEPPKGHG